LLCGVFGKKAGKLKMDIAYRFRCYPEQYDSSVWSALRENELPKALVAGNQDSTCSLGVC